jgi:DtxR family Mn-dependent transcriptional regulator
MRTTLIILAVLLLLASLVWPRRGLLARWRRVKDNSRRARREDALKHILKSEANGRVASVESLAGALQITTGRAARLLEDLERAELLSFEAGKLRLEPAGREIGLHVVRAHRLWESFLAEQTGVAEREWHQRAEKEEHRLTPTETELLAAQLGHPTRDPHGDVIPEPSGTLEGDLGQSLNSAAPDVPFLITHIEDEPDAVYRQLLALGLRPGMRGFVIEKSATRIRFWADGNEHILAPVLAENVSIRLLPEFRTAELIEEQFLSGLRRGERARVLGLSPACRSPERRRLLDLGFVPGTLVEVDMVSPMGDPVAYRVRGSVVALRREQANLVRIGSPEVAVA